MERGARHRRLFGLLLVVAAAVYLAGNGRVDLWDRDESRYAQTSRQMVQSGDWVVPMLLDQPREKKPILIYWLQAASMTALDATVFAARLPSSIAMSVALLLMFVALGRAMGHRRALLACLVLGSSALAIASAKMCITDATLLLFVLAAQFGLYAMWRGDARWRVVIFTAAATGLAGLTKGPVVLGVMATTLAALGALRWIDRRRAAPVAGRRLGGGAVVARVAVFALICAAILAPWLWLMEQRLPGYTLRTLWDEVVVRAGKPQEGHKGPPGYYLLTLWGAFFPWCLLLPAALIDAWRRRFLPPVRFALAASAGPWAMFELVQTKLPHYVLPTYPFLAILVAELIVRASRARLGDLTNRAFRTGTDIWAGAVVVMGVLPWALPLWFGPLPAMAYAGMATLSVLAILYAAWVRGLWAAYRPIRAAAAMGAGMFAIVVAAHLLLLPHLPFLRVSRQSADLLRADGAVPPAAALMIDYKETSLAYYQGGSIRPMRDDAYLATSDPLYWPRWFVVTSEVWEGTPEPRRAMLSEVGRVRGLAYADGMRLVELIVLRRRGE